MVTDSAFGLPPKEQGWQPHHLHKGLSFDMYDGRTATLLTNGRTPFEWLVMFSDSTSAVLTEEFILDRLNGPSEKEEVVPPTIPVTMFIRPNGKRHQGSIWVPEGTDLERLEAKLAEMVECGVIVTSEEISPTEVNVCLDDGDFDYQVELFRADETINQKITDLVLAFDPEDYRKVRRQKEEAGEL